jgi:hypothetical protein
MGALAVTVTASLAFGAPSHAAARPTPDLSAVQQQGVSCEFQVGDSSIATRCYFPGPTNRQYRAWAECTNGRIATGAWYYVNSGSWSRANCGTNIFVVDWGFDLR